MDTVLLAAQFGISDDAETTGWCHAALCISKFKFVNALIASIDPGVYVVLKIK